MAISDFLFYHSFRVRYSEIDSQKIVFNAHYLTYFDTAITELFRWLGFDYNQYSEETGYDFHTVRSLVEYHKPIFFDEEIIVYVRVANIKRSALFFVIEIYDDSDAKQARATGEVVWVHADKKTMKSSLLGAEFVDLIKKVTTPLTSVQQLML